jgi:hypothetical protein
MPSIDNANQTSPTWDTFDPDQIADPATSWKPSESLPQAQGLRGIRAPSGGGTLVFKQATHWTTQPPGSSLSGGWFTRTFTSLEPLLDVQIVEIRKSGSTAGAWEILL